MAGPYAVVANFGDGTVTFVDTSNDTPLGLATPVGVHPCGVAVTPDGTKAVVVCQSGSVYILSMTTQTVLHIVNGLPAFQFVAIRGDGAVAFLSGDQAVGNLLYTLDLTAYTTTNLAPGAGTDPYGLCIADGKLYVCDNNSDAVWIYNPTTFALISTKHTGLSGQSGCIATADGTKVYVTGAGSNSVVPIPTSTDTPGTAIPVGNTPLYGGSKTDSSEVWICNNVANTISVINTGSNTVTHTIGPLSPNNCRDCTAFDNDAYFYAGLFSGANLSKISTTTYTEVATVGVGGAPFIIAMGPVLGPTVTGLSVSSGPTLGGTAVTITGSGFTGATAVDFGATPAASFVVNNDTTITAVTPAEASATVHTTVTTPSGTSATGSGDQFSFLPGVTNVSPNAGGTGGGDTVTITGYGYSTATAVDFGATAVGAFTVVSDTSITTTAPAHVAGTVDVTVIAPGGTSPTSVADKYRYVAVVGYGQSVAAAYKPWPGGGGVW
jgi:YVTN family beta-propeller protein